MTENQPCGNNSAVGKGPTITESSTMSTKPTRGRPKGTAAKYLIVCKAYFDGGDIAHRACFKQAARAQKWLDEQANTAESIVAELVGRDSNEVIAQFTYRNFPVQSEAHRFNVAQWIADQTQGQ